MTSSGPSNTAGPAVAAQPSAPAAAEQAGQPRNPWPALSIALVGTFMAILDSFIVFVASPAIQSDLHASDAQVQLVVAGYQFTYAIALITGSRLGDIHGRKRMFMAGMALFTLSSVACGVAPNSASLIVARLVQGLSAALMFPQVFAMIQVLLPPPKRARAFGVLGAVIGGATIVGQIVGGLLIAANLFNSSWRPVFWVNVPVGLVALVLAARYLPESRAPQARGLDLPGVAVLTVAIGLLVVPLIEGRQEGWPWWTWASLAASVVVFAVFVAVERRVEAAGRSPLISPRLFGERAFSIGICLVVIAYMGVNSFFLILSLTLQNGLGLSALDAGLAYTPLAVAFFITSLVAGRLTPRYGRRVLEVGAFTAAIGFIGTMAVAGVQQGNLTTAELIGPLVLVGAGNGLLLPPLLNTVLARVVPEQAGMASGVLSTGQQVGGVLGVAVIGVLFFSALGSKAVGVASNAHALTTAVVFNLAIDAVGIALLYALPKAGGGAKR